MWFKKVPEEEEVSRRKKVPEVSQVMEQCARETTLLLKARRFGSPPVTFVSVLAGTLGVDEVPITGTGTSVGVDAEVGMTPANPEATIPPPFSVNLPTFKIMKGSKSRSTGSKGKEREDSKWGTRRIRYVGVEVAVPVVLAVEVVGKGKGGVADVEGRGFGEVKPGVTAGFRGGEEGFERVALAEVEGWEALVVASAVRGRNPDPFPLPPALIFEGIPSTPLSFFPFDLTKRGGCDELRLPRTREIMLVLGIELLLLWLL